MKSTKQPLPGENSLPSYFSALKFTCECFGVEMPQMERMLQIIRQREQQPDEYFPKRLSRVMLNDAERGTGKWAKMDHRPLETLAKETVYDQIRRHEDGKPLFGVAGDLAERLTFSLLRLYKIIAPKLNTDGIPEHECIWVLIEEVFAPTVFIELKSCTQRGLQGEFQPDDTWYMRRQQKGQIFKPFPRVLHYLFHAAGYRYTHDFGKENDSLRRKADRWLKDGKLPKKKDIHSFVKKLAEAGLWLEKPDDWEPRLMLARAADRACQRMDECFRSQKAYSSLEFAKTLERIGDEKMTIDDGQELAKSETFFAARLLQHRLQKEGRWEAEVMSFVCKGEGKTFFGGISDEEIKQYKSDLNWRMNPGNWFLEFIKREPDLQKVAKEGKGLSEAILDLGIRELNLILDAKRGRRANARRP